jgi:enamine deaminase RidA (YjgF/YER057c/UK114 family)
MLGRPVLDLPEGVHPRDASRVERQLVPAESPMAATVGYSRAVRVGPHVHVAGTAPIMPGDANPPADPYGQAKRCLEIIVAALAEVGAKPEHVVRTRIYLTAAEDWQDVGRAHGEIFASVKPASAMVVVRGLLDPRWRVEIEVDAFIDA